MTDSISIVMALLKAAGPVTAIVGVRNYPIRFPQGAVPPCNVISIVGGKDEQTLLGAGHYFEGHVEIASISLDETEVMTLGTAVRTALGDVMKATVGSATDVDVYFDDVDITDDADDRSTVRRLQRFCVRYR